MISRRYETMVGIFVVASLLALLVMVIHHRQAGRAFSGICGIQGDF